MGNTTTGKLWKVLDEGKRVVATADINWKDREGDFVIPDGCKGKVVQSGKVGQLIISWALKPGDDYECKPLARYPNFKTITKCGRKFRRVIGICDFCKQEIKKWEMKHSQKYDNIRLATEREQEVEDRKEKEQELKAKNAEEARKIQKRVLRQAPKQVRPVAPPKPVWELMPVMGSTARPSVQADEEGAPLTSPISLELDGDSEAKHEVYFNKIKAGSYGVVQPNWKNEKTIMIRWYQNIPEMNTFIAVDKTYPRPGQKDISEEIYAERYKGVKFYSRFDMDWLEDFYQKIHYERDYNEGNTCTVTEL